MDASEVIEVCRLCPATGANQCLLSVFDERLSVKNNMKEVILVTTGIEILESDLVSKKICQRCCNITLKMFGFRQDALKQDRALKEKCNQILGDKGIRLPNTCITIKQERKDTDFDVPPSINTHPREILHPSVKQLYQTFPNLKLPKACLNRHITPVVSLPMGDVEKYFKKQKLDIKNYIYKPRNRNRSQSIAKKRTSGVSHECKIVAPLKISKKTLGTHKQSPVDKYVCHPINRENIERKRAASLSDAGRSKILKQIESSQLVKTNLDANQSNLATSLTADFEIIKEPGTPIREVTRPVEKVEVRGNIAASSSSIETASSSGNKPYFFESFGLTPTVTATKTLPLSMCNLCGSVHNNAFELNRHTTNKHMTCQFCKRRFKSLEAKTGHIDNHCEIKKIMNSSGPVISLEKIHLNLNVRRKYMNAFKQFGPIRGLEEPLPIEEVIVRATSPLSLPNDVIVLSDDEDVPDPIAENDTLISDLPPVPDLEPIQYNTVSIVRPDVRIKNNPILNQLSANIGDYKLLKKLIHLAKNKTDRVDKNVQTDLPVKKDIQISASDGICEFKNLKQQLFHYKIPVNITDGPFHVDYQFKGTPKPKHKTNNWNNLSQVDAKESTTKNTAQAKRTPTPIPSTSQNPPLSTSNIPSTITSSLQQLLSAQVVPGTTTTYFNPLPTVSSVPAISVAQPYTIPISANSATPILQSYALSLTPANPVAYGPIRIPKQFWPPINNRNMQTMTNNSTRAPSTFSGQDPGIRLQLPSDNNVSCRLPINSAIPSMNTPNSSVIPPGNSPSSSAMPPRISLNSTIKPPGNTENSLTIPPRNVPNSLVISPRHSQNSTMPTRNFANPLPITSNKPINILPRPPSITNSTSENNNSSAVATTESTRFRVKNISELR